MSTAKTGLPLKVPVFPGKNIRARPGDKLFPIRAGTDDKTFFLS